MTDSTTPAPPPADGPATTADVVIIGAAFAGLAAAQVLGRAQRRVVVLGQGPARNAEAQHAHNVLTRDGTPPAELLRLAVDEVAALPTVDLAEAHVTAVHPSDDGDGLRVETATGLIVTAPHVVLATGARDRLPDVPGLPGLWGRRAHSCPFCDGEPYAGRRLLVLADGAGGGHLTGILAGWTDRLTVADPSQVTSLEEAAGAVVVRMVDGTEIEVDGVFVQTTPLVRLEPVAHLALARRGPYLAVDGDGRTSLPGLWAAGDCAWVEGSGFPGGQVIAAMADGARAGAAITLDLLGIHRPPPPPVETPVETPADAPTETPAEDHDHTHGGGTGAAPTLDGFWEAHYQAREQVWSGFPNVGLVEGAADLPPGRALDLGSGEGGDAIWLADRGWEVTAVDISATALARGQAAAQRRGVSDRIRWVQADLGTAFPAGTFDLVVAAYLLSPVEIPREAIVRRAAEAVAPGGTLVVLSHGWTPWAGAHHPTVSLPDIPEQLDQLALGAGWTVNRSETFERAVRGPDGTVMHVTDTLIAARRS